MGSSIHNIIKSEYEKRQRRAYDGQLQRKADVYAKIPRLEEIEDEIHLSGLKYNKLLLSGETPAERVIAELHSHIGSLKREKALLLEKNGYTHNYLDPAYACEKCRDTGTVSAGAGSADETCTCYRQQLINIIYGQSNLRLTGSENFNCFKEDFYSDTIDEGKYGIKKSPRKQIMGIKDKCLSFVEDFKSPDIRNMLFCGPTGSGKTFMANCTAIELMNRGVTVLYQSAPVLFSTINEYRYKSSREDGFENTVYRNIIEVELLIIDDLGTESPSAARYAELLTIFDTRFANNLKRPCKTIISTNIDMKKLSEYYDERVVSRIIGNFDIYKFAGDDIRKLKSSIA